MSSANQQIQQLRNLISTATWADSPSEVVVGTSTYITPEISDEQQLPARTPFALLNVGDATEDQDEADYLTQDFYVVLATVVSGHNLGEYSITGGPGRETGKSKGRGILEIQSPVLEQIKLLKGADDTVPRIAPGSFGGMRWRDGAQLAWRQYKITSLCTLEDSFPAPRELEASGNVLSWTLPPSRFDLDSIVLRYASGATPPASETAGTGITLSGDLATTHDVSAIGAGTYSFALFAKYEDTNASDAKHSDQDTGSYRASVTVT